MPARLSPHSSILNSDPHFHSPGARTDAVAVATNVESGIKSVPGVASGPAPSTAQVQSAYAQQLAEIPEFESYGAVLKSSAKPVDLTESEMEYVVACVKHIFVDHVVFQVRLSSPLV